VKSRDSLLPLRPAATTPGSKPVTAAPAWVALLTAWLGLITLGTSLALPFVPGSKNPRAELEHARPYSAADRFILVPVYGSVAAIFLGIVVLWQMRREARPLAPPLVAQRLQAWAGMCLALAGVVFFYIYVAWSMAWRAAPGS
jgi:hypothetical protein